MYFDWTYVVLVLPCMLLAMWASSNVNSTFRKYSQQTTSRLISGKDAAQRVLSHNGVSGVRIEHISGNLTDHYDPTANVIRLSDDVYNGCSTAAIGVACHEAGHAVQHARGYLPIKVRAAIIPVTNFGAKLSMPLILLGLVLSSGGRYFYELVYLGIACFSLSTLFQLITLPVEFDASNRALRAISDAGILREDELRGARKTLRAAALTYVAALAVSAAQLLRLIMLYGGGRNRRRR